MTRKIILVNTHEAKTKLSALIKSVEEEGALVQICRQGKPIVELRAVETVGDPLKRHPKIAGIKFFEDPSAPVDPRDWPEEYR